MFLDGFACCSWHFVIYWLLLHHWLLAVIVFVVLLISLFLNIPNQANNLLNNSFLKNYKQLIELFYIILILIRKQIINLISLVYFFREVVLVVYPKLINIVIFTQYFLLVYFLLLNNILCLFFCLLWLFLGWDDMLQLFIYDVKFYSRVDLKYCDSYS